MNKDAKIVGFDLLRIWLSVEVVFDHFWSVHGSDGVTMFFRQMAAAAVPCFMIMSFYLTERRYAAGDRTWFVGRLVRLLTPYLFWPVVCYAMMLVCTGSPAFVEEIGQLAAFKHYGTSVDAPFTDLLWQWLLGSSRRYSMQLWFLADLIMLTVAIFALFKVTAERWRVPLLVLLIAVGLGVQYSPLNVWMFGDLPFESRYTLGRLAPMLVLASVGLLFGRLRGRLAELSLSSRLVVVAAGLGLFVFVQFARPFRPIPGFSYQGLDRIFLALGLVAAFHFLPFERLPGVVVRALSYCSRYCMGIYCVHFGLALPLYAFVFPHIGIGRSTLASNLLIWLASWLFCHLVALVPGRFSKLLVQ